MDWQTKMESASVYYVDGNIAISIPIDDISFSQFKSITKESSKQ